MIECIPLLRHTKPGITGKIYSETATLPKISQTNEEYSNTNDAGFVTDQLSNDASLEHDSMSFNHSVSEAYFSSFNSNPGSCFNNEESSNYFYRLIRSTRPINHMQTIMEDNDTAWDTVSLLQAHINPDEDEIDDEWKTPEEIRKLEELDNPNRVWKNTRNAEKFIQQKLKNILEFKELYKNNLMDSLLIQHSSLIRRLRRKISPVTVLEIKLFFDNIVSYMKDITYTTETDHGLNILTIICDDLASINTLRLFDHPVLINHSIFIYIGRTLEMLLIKSNYIKSIPMKKCEEDCFYSISYLIAQLCLFRNETLTCFYGSISHEITPVTDKINIRDETIDENSRRSKPIADKPNFKVTCLPPSVPKSRPVEKTQFDMALISHRKKFPTQFIELTAEKEIEPTVERVIKPDISILLQILPSKKYQDVFLNESFLNKLIRAINDVSQNEYSLYHIKYKVIDRFVRVCSKLNIVDRLFNPIITCLRSKFYREIFTTIESEQLRLSPKQLFFIYQCSQFIIQHDFQEKEQIPHLLCETMIDATESIIETILPISDNELDPKYYDDRGIALYAFRCHLKLLNYLSLTSSGRRYFIKNNIIDKITNVLEHDILIDNACQNEELFHADVATIAYTLMLLYNLAYEKHIFSILKRKDFRQVFTKLESAKDITLRFAYKTLSKILSSDQIHKENKPMKLKQDYAKYIEENFVEPKLKIKLGLLKANIELNDNVKVKFIDETYLTHLCRDIEDLSTKEYPSNALKYKDVGRRVRVASKQELKEVELLIDPILKCLNSNFYLKVFENIELVQTKAASTVTTSNSGLAAKHIFFMHECPEFLFRNDYNRRKDIANSLGKTILKYTETIFNQHLSILMEDKGEVALNDTKIARMVALSYHIRMLNHFAMIRTIRKEFLSLPIVDQLFSILKDQSLIDENRRTVEARAGVIGQSLILFYNLGFDNRLRSQLMTKNILNICLKLRCIRDKLIHFISHFILIMFNSDIYNDIYDPPVLAKTCVEYIDKCIKEPRLAYQGLKLYRLLRHLEIFVLNDTFTESFAEEKQGISVIIKCFCLIGSEEKHVDDQKKELLKRIQQSAVFIIWKLSFYGPTTNKKLKSNNLFIDQILMLLNGTSKKSKQNASAIIWRLGSEETIRYEQTEKEKHQTTTMDDDRSISNDEWDETIPYDLLISVSNIIDDMIVAKKIFDRLSSRGYRVYNEKQGKHRLELMKKAITQKKTILVCLSSKYRLSKICMAEIEYANKHSSPIIPVIVEAKFKMQGWLKHLIGGKNPIDLTQKNFNEELLKVFEEIEKQKSSD
ncbi:unnamed protein product [Rotaria sordida]|uniref:TIR domain-containing protein n=2 Tax=Rotaria sordida TaxID=392033 RepID=A0A819S1Y8_9BILA|nr:unnamed protein product [Rotaria sordida]